MTSTTVTTASPAAAVGAALTLDGPRPKRPSAVATSLSFGWRALLKIKHVPEQLFDVTMFPIMFTLMFTFLFGGALAGSTEAYVQFLIPGILVQTVVMITMYTGLTLNKDIEKGVFDRFRSLPIWRPAPLVGALLGDMVRYTIASIIVMVLGLILGFRPAGGVVGVVASIALLLLFSFAMSWIWTMFAMLMRTEQAVMGVSMFILFPLTFASNIFVDPSTMPGWLQAFVDVNPISHLVTACRDLMAGTAGVDQLWTVFAWCAGFVVVFGPITMRLYNRKS
ncbi:ABC transporter permease [Rhodococcus gannanensis]|uniref:Transport permease protein n=1 Tax=Rhodococcus gannanensis TaxID=1960308 RepID=A0ABW4P6W6_9NOCA